MKANHLIFKVGCFYNSIKSNYIFNISFSPSLSENVLGEKLLILISNDGETERRFKINDDFNAQLTYGMVVDQ